MKEKIFEVHVVTKATGRCLCMFYVNAMDLFQAARYADEYLVPEALTVSSIFTSPDSKERIMSMGHEIYEAV